MWIKSNDDGRMAMLRYNFNNYYDSAFDHRESTDVFDNHNDLAFKLNASEIDTDNDGISDNMELMLGLNPNSDRSDNDTFDSDRIFTRNINFEEGYAVVTGHADIYNVTIDKLSLNAVRSNVGAVTSPYELYSESGFVSVKIRFKYDLSKLNLLRAGIDSLHVYKFDPYSRTYSDIGGVVISDESFVECDLESNGVYLLGSDGLIDKSAEAYVSENTNVHLIIDNSGSLYESTDTYRSEENDVDFKRLSFAKKFVSDYDDGAKFAISVFTYGFKTLCDFDDDKSHVMNAIESIRTLGAGFDGTSVERAMVEGIELFSDDMINERNIIVILTDGISTDTAGYSTESILMRAKAKNVTIMTISLGRSYDKELLENIAENTGGRYFSILDSGLLENLHFMMNTSISDDIVDDDNNGEFDSYMMYDTGFNFDENSFNFDIYFDENSESVDFGMALLAKDWFRNDLDRDAKDMIGDVLDVSEPLHKYYSRMLSDYSDPDRYLDFKSNGDTLRIGSVRNDAISKGWKAITKGYDEPLSGWSKIELLVPGISTNLIGGAYSNVDDKLLKLIDYYNKKQTLCKQYGINNESSIDKTKQILNGGNPIVMKLSWIESDSCLSRYVLLTSFRRDLSDPNVFKMKVYDIIGHSMDDVILTRKKVVLSTGVDHVYVGSWEGKNVIITGYCE